MPYLHSHDTVASKMNKIMIEIIKQQRGVRVLGNNHVMWKYQNLRKIEIYNIQYDMLEYQGRIRKKNASQELKKW
jgi:hypothetical protein